MRPENVFVVLKREYLQRVKNKAFWIATLIVPLFATAVTTLPTLFLAGSHTSQTLVVVDESGQGIGQALKAEVSKVRAEAPKKAKGLGSRGGGDSRTADFKIESQAPAADRETQRRRLDAQVRDEKIDAWVWIGKGVLGDEPVEYHARNTSNVFTQETLRGDLSEVARRIRLRQAGIDPARMEELTKRVELKAQQVPGTGTSGGGVSGLVFAFVLFFLLYMSILMWGQQVMQGVLEEKGTRVIEVLISALTPFELMMGKLLGICLVGLTQLAIWLGTVVVLTALLFILGFFAYATMYAAIGASFNNLQEAQQVAGVVVVFVVAPVMVIYPVINDPNSTMAVTMSLIPLFTPLIMPLRIAIEMPPAWQLALAYALTLSFVVGMVWICSRIYRVGILLYGKKPTLQEIWRWTRYS
jgi:ABC-2 type transport system permease protein